MHYHQHDLALVPDRGSGRQDRSLLHRSAGHPVPAPRVAATVLPSAFAHPRRGPACREHTTNSSPPSPAGSGVRLGRDLDWPETAELLRQGADSLAQRPARRAGSPATAAAIWHRIPGSGPPMPLQWICSAPRRSADQERLSFRPYDESPTDARRSVSGAGRPEPDAGELRASRRQPISRAGDGDAAPGPATRMATTGAGPPKPSLPGRTPPRRSGHAAGSRRPPPRTPPRAGPLPRTRPASPTRRTPATPRSFS